MSSARVDELPIYSKSNPESRAPIKRSSILISWLGVVPVPAWFLLVSSALLVVLSAVLALLAVVAFAAVYQLGRHELPSSPGPTAVSIIPPEPPSLCANPGLRQEWRDLNNEQKSEFIVVIQCLQRLPGLSNGLQGAKTRFDDFQALHVVVAQKVHLVGQFLPWHRRMLNVFEMALQQECGYQGSVPYWDWSRDVDSGLPLSESPVFDAVYGLGGNGVDVPNYAGQFGNLTLLSSAGWVPPESGGGCVPDGPFASYQLNVGPGTNVTSHCLQRAINDEITGFLSGEKVEDVMRQPTFETFRVQLEGAPVTETMRLHDAGHNAVGGEMADNFSSPGDPIFYLHHAFLDKLWWEWVGMNFTSRIDDISGRTTAQSPYVNVTLDFELDMMMLAPTVTIREVKDTRNPLLCYVYQ